MSRIWKRKAVNQQSGFDSLANSATSLLRPRIIEEILQDRGYKNEQEKEKFLGPKISELRSPFDILNLEKACGRLVQALQNKEKICIYADFDLDGTSGCALLYEGLSSIGYDVIPYQPLRLSEGYGFHASAVRELKTQGISLIITVDVGITSFAACEEAKACGIDVILTDHHQPLEKLPEAWTIVNPNQKECGSGLGYLSGAGVAFYLLRGLMRKLTDAGLIKKSELGESSVFELRKSLDFLVIATLTDMVPLVGDNRTLAKVGLLQLQKTERPGLRALLKELDLYGRPLTAQDVAIRFAPKLNALSRMEKGLKPLDVYLVDSDEKAEALIGDVLNNNSERVQLQASGEALAVKMLENWPHDKFVFVASNEFHRGVVGLIATKLAALFNVPAFVASISADGEIVGSGRLPNGSTSSLVRALESAQGFLARFGGHHQAAGFEVLTSEQIPQVIDALELHFKNETNNEAQIVTEYDADLYAEEVSEGLLRWMDILGPFGQAFQIPLLRIADLEVASLKKLKGNHLKMSFKKQGLSQNLDSIWFSPPENISVELGSRVEVLVELQWNYFGGGRPKIQLLIRDLQTF